MLVILCEVMSAAHGNEGLDVQRAFGFAAIECLTVLVRDLVTCGMAVKLSWMSLHPTTFQVHVCYLHTGIVNLACVGNVLKSKTAAACKDFHSLIKCPSR